MKIFRIIKRVIIVLFFLGVSVGVFTLGAYKVVEKKAKGKVYNSVSEIPYNKVGLLLGTSKYAAGGRQNLYYKYRIDAAVMLYQSGKVNFILVSGDNSVKEYDEPTTIKKDLIRRGIPAERIYLDYAGFRTLDSVVRSKEIFGQESITVVSQQFHVERAIYIASKKNMDAVGFNARDVGVNYGFKTKVRERFARVKMFLDLIFQKKPKFLGEKIEIK